MGPAPDLVARFAADFDALIPPGERIGLAVSGGPDSLALLLLAASSRPGHVEAATVDHALRQDSDREARFVADICRTLGVPHAVLTLTWPEPPASRLQEKARHARYGALGEWAVERGLPAVATGHHADDQAETLLMRLMRGAGVRGLAGMRPAATLPGSEGIRLLRPLLGWRRNELAALCAAAGTEPVNDPSNEDERFERARLRSRMAEVDWLDAAALAESAAHLDSADEALEWCARQQAVKRGREGAAYRPNDAPAEIRRRVVAAIIAELATEGGGEPLRGRELDGALAALSAGGTVTLRGVRCCGGVEWRFAPAPPRRN